MLKLITVIGSALIGYGLYFFIFVRKELEYTTQYIWTMRFRGIEYQLFSKEIVGLLSLVGGFILIIFAIIFFMKEKRK